MLLKKLSYDVLTTLLVEIEETLNSRPMTYLSDDTMIRLLPGLIYFVEETYQNKT